jgi:ferredoxin
MLRKLVKDRLNSALGRAAPAPRPAAPAPPPAPVPTVRPVAPVVVAPVVVAPVVVAPVIVAPVVVAPVVAAPPAPRAASFTSGAKGAPAVGGLRQAEDGGLYWGPIDNESARAKAAGLTLIVDQWECINCGTCVENTDAVFVLPDDAKAVAYRQEGAMDLIQDAIDACPVTCIHWTDDPSKYPAINDAKGRPVQA